MADSRKNFHDNLSPEKAAFMASMLEEMKGKNQSDLLPFLMNVATRGASSGIDFSDDETNHLVNLLTANMGAKERQQVAMLQQLTKMMGKKQKR